MSVLLHPSTSNAHANRHHATRRGGLVRTTLISLVTDREWNLRWSIKLYVGLYSWDSTRCPCTIVIAARYLPQIANVSRYLPPDSHLGGSDSIPIGEGVVLILVLLFLVVRRLGLPWRRDGGLRRPRRPGRGGRTRRLGGRARLESQARHSRERWAVRRKRILPLRSLGCHFGQLVYRPNGVRSWGRMKISYCGRDGLALRCHHPSHCRRRLSDQVAQMSSRL